MKNIILIAAVLLALGSCTSQSANKQDPKYVLKPSVNEEGQYELIVMDSQYDYFLHAVARPMNSYSEASLKNKNRFLVSEWNGLYYSGRHRNVIESSIEYDPAENYGLEFEYRLYQVFAYVSWKYGLKLNGLSQTDSF